MTARRRIHVSPRNPRAAAQCDRCCRIFFHDQLVKEMAYRGDRTVWNGLMVCRHCLDAPQPQDRRRQPGRDPIPVQNPRFQDQESNLLITQSGDVLTTDGGDALTWW
ncbi:hypothetical protein ABNQ39_00190 (plasmid) [Azospirillum sp. A26]|uniref:hypothetical protein n=1 Tax=Azospirillum sp. A26 TaxID=3160607 RepID=UPI00366D749D